MIPTLSYRALCVSLEVFYIGTSQRRVTIIVRFLKTKKTLFIRVLQPCSLRCCELLHFCWYLSALLLSHKPHVYLCCRTETFSNIQLAFFSNQISYVLLLEHSLSQPCCSDMKDFKMSLGDISRLLGCMHSVCSGCVVITRHYNSKAKVFKMFW